MWSGDVVREMEGWVASGGGGGVASGGLRGDCSVHSVDSLITKLKVCHCNNTASIDPSSLIYQVCVPWRENTCAYTRLAWNLPCPPFSEHVLLHSSKNQIRIFGLRAERVRTLFECGVE